MSTVLAITSSALGDASVSDKLVGDALTGLRARDPGLEIIVRDLGRYPVPHLDADSATALRGAEPANPAQAAARALSDQMIAELRAADLILIGAPMYNFGMTSTLKAWFDHVLRAGETFRYSAAGPQGLLEGKRALVIETRGGIYSEGPAQAMDSQEPHLRTLLAFIGVSDVTFIRAEGLAIDADRRASAIEAARRELDRVTAEPLPEAA
ncbi:FMN-dependent NADH-azoreductase [Aurantimonas sp. HBX-1]|uniref:FMN-dependent NADH-azoreductase n=1 Tax=Aurantimonas sp. HBX-1 TaxID=2906072 RepID=UPI001F2F0BA4|nr:FMN-dependent NADH-azoreductase [Aurantimonas sp. HBX-1]UIJ72698.1 FMN-dependent NADH-azoreductase [Aurantimonas sp. HBX-1]